MLLPETIEYQTKTPLPGVEYLSLSSLEMVKTGQAIAITFSYPLQLNIKSLLLKISYTFGHRTWQNQAATRNFLLAG